jgi:hypothetical protein
MIDLGSATLPNDICELVKFLGLSMGVGGSARAGMIVMLNMVVMALAALVIMVAFVSIVIGGYIYMTAGGSADRIKVAKTWIVSAVLGIVLALSSWIILNAINPYLLGG